MFISVIININMTQAVFLLNLRKVKYTEFVLDHITAWPQY